MICQIMARVDRNNAGGVFGFGSVDRRDGCVRKWGPQKGSVDHARQSHIVNELPTSLQQARRICARRGFADIAVWFVENMCRTSHVRASSITSQIASTMD